MWKQRFPGNVAGVGQHVHHDAEKADSKKLVDLGGERERWAKTAMISIIIYHIMSNVMDFSDHKHELAELAFQGAEEMDLEQYCSPEMFDVLATWRDRADHRSSGAECFRIPDCPVFSITYEGKVAEYWPNESENDIIETLVREFLYRDGICSLTDERVRLIHMKYNIMALAGDEYVLVCPYLTEAGNISGIVVVCATKLMRHADQSHMTP